MQLATQYIAYLHLEFSDGLAFDAGLWLCRAEDIICPDICSRPEVSDTSRVGYCLLTIYRCPATTLTGLATARTSPASFIQALAHSKKWQRASPGSQLQREKLCFKPVTATNLGCVPEFHLWGSWNGVNARNTEGNNYEIPLLDAFQDISKSSPWIGTYWSQGKIPISGKWKAHYFRQ